MSALLAVARRELGSYFRTPAGWIILALYLFLSGLIFALSCLSPGATASMRDVFALSGWLLLPVAPAVSMRLIAEEIRAGTMESLASSPVSSASLVLGKYLGACGFLLAVIAPTLSYVAMLMAIAEPAPDLGPMLSGYLCLVLLGAFYLAVGTVCSSLTSNATLAFMTAFFALLALLFASSAASFVPDHLKPALFALSINLRVGDFARGVIDTAHVVFFVSLSALMLFIAVAAVEIRRWR
jgi:ABC-2 type transport system permease protein